MDSGKGVGFTQALKEFMQDTKLIGTGNLTAWLQDKMLSVFGGTGLSIAEEIVSGIRTYERNQAEISRAISEGKSKEEWVSEKVLDAVDGLEEKEKKQVLTALHQNLIEELGIETNTEENEIVMTEQREFEQENRYIAQSFAEMSTVRAMQVIGMETEESTEVEHSDVMENFLNEATSDSLKKIASGALVAAVKKGLLSVFPATAPVHIITQIACFGVDNAKIIYKVAQKELSFTEGLRIISQKAVATLFGVVADENGKVSMTSLTQRMPFLKKPMEYISHVSSSILQFAGNESLRMEIGRVKQKMVPVVQNMIGEFVKCSFSTVKRIANRINNKVFN